MQSITYKKLTAQDLEQSFSLQQAVYEDLSPDKKLFILPKTKEQMLDYITNSGMAFGCFIGETLVSHVYFAFLDKECTVGTQIDWVDNNTHFLDNRLTFAMPKAVETHPVWRGKGIMSKLLDFGFGEIKEVGREQLITDIAFHNEESLSIFMKKGFRMIAVDHPQGDIELAIVYRDLARYERRCVNTHTLETCSMHDYDYVKSAIENGYYPTYLDNKSYTLMPSAIIDDKKRFKCVA